MHLRAIAALSAATAIVLGVFGGSAGAVTNGTYDGDNHPYVAYLDNGVFACTGTLLSPTVMLTAAHCFTGGPSAFGTNSATGAPIVRASFDPNLINTPAAERVWWFGSYYSDPDFAVGAGGGLPGFDTHDIAVVVFTSAGCRFPAGSGIRSCGPVPSSATLDQYGALPEEGVVDTLRQNAPIDVVGFGVQTFLNGGGPCGGPCKKTPTLGEVTRSFAPTTLLSSNNSISHEFLRLHSNKGGTCFGDSGGPDLLGGTNVVVGINSFVANGICTSNTYSYRADTAQALDWIHDTVADHPGASVP